MKWITALNLDSWANTLNARITTSELISALIRGSSESVQNVRFPTGDSAQIPGWDGVLRAIGVPPFVPDGDSVWEIGVDIDYFGKANEDFDKRSQNPRCENPSTTTYVFVTPRTWKRANPTLSEWEAEKRHLGLWKNVKVIDGIGLEEWLDRTPIVAAYFARQVLKLFPPTEARSTSEFWDQYSALFKPNLTEAILVCDRSEQVKWLLGELAVGPKEILIRSDSPDEVVAFAVAAIRNADSDLRKFLEARTIVLDSENAARQFATQSGYIFIPRASAMPLAASLAQRGPTVIALGREASNRREATVLNRPSVRELSKALETMGFPPEKAQQVARESGRSVTILARRIPRAGSEKPQWADGQRTLIPALLAGGWDSSSKEDQGILSKLAGDVDYADFETPLLALSRLQDPPIDREGAVWKVRAPVDAFAHLAPLIGRKDLERLEAVVTDVFSEYDPALDLPEDERPFAATHNKKLRHSDWLRDGLATTLLQIAVLGKEIELSIPNSTPERFVERLVEGLAGLNKDFRLIASLQNQLTLLMEAAPRPLVQTLEQLLEGDGSRLKGIFREGGIFAPSSPHTSLLWGLEILAWDPYHLSRVAIILAKLARIDPGGKLQNRPINSLASIFLSWHPSTNANLDQRLGVLDQVIQQEPVVGWDLLVKLLPVHHGVAHNNPQPKYREAGASEREVLTWAIVRKSVNEIIDRAIAIASQRPERWSTLIEGMSQFPPDKRRYVTNALTQLADKWSPDDRKIVWSTLRDEVARHLQFPSVDWSIKEPEISQLQAVVDKLQPDAPLERLAWLFNDHYPDVPRELDEGRRDAVEEAREKAAREVLEREGREGLLALAAMVSYPQFLAIAAAAVLDRIDDFEWLVSRAIGGGEERDIFALALSGEAERRFGREWKGKVTGWIREQRYSPREATTLILGWADDPETWEVVDSFDQAVHDEYWRRKYVPHLADDVQGVIFVAKKYLSVGRPGGALDVSHRLADRLPPGLMLEILDAEFTRLTKHPEEANNMLVHYVDDVFKKLRKRTDVSKIELAKREYAYLPFFAHRDDTLTLHQLMAEDPSFFVSILSDVFKPASSEPREPTEERRSKAKAGFQLLSSFKTVPGGLGSAIDEEVLNAWVDGVRARAAEVDRARIADQYVGHVLAHAPHDPTDNAWPHRVIRGLIERVSSGDVETGIQVERHNMRGVFSKQMFEGGKQERAFAREARAWAAVCAPWPRTSAMLGEYAKGWDEYADREDQRARQDQMRFE